MITFADVSQKANTLDVKISFLVSAVLVIFHSLSLFFFTKNRRKFEKKISLERFCAQSFATFYLLCLARYLFDFSLLTRQDARRI